MWHQSSYHNECLVVEIAERHRTQSASSLAHVLTKPRVSLQMFAFPLQLSNFADLERLYVKIFLFLFG